MRRLLALGAMIVAVSAGSARGAVLDFEDLPLDPSMISPGGDRLSRGFLFDSALDHIHVDDDSWGTANGSRFLVIDLTPNPVAFAPASGAPFSLTSMDISEAHTLNAWSRQIEVTGTKVGGATVFTVLTLDGNINAAVLGNYFETFTFDSTWTDLASVVLNGIGAQCCGQPPGNYYAVDNIVVDVAAVPEPGTLSLVGLGAAYIAVRRRGRRGAE